jgi:Ca2+/Na+ antiporter
MTSEDKNNNKSNSKLKEFLKKNSASVILAIALFIVFAWFSIKIKTNEFHFENEKTQLITKYETERDSLQIKHLEFASTVFSWSVRSELLRNNTENLNQLLTVFIKKSGADLVQLINPENNVILLSSDKKFEGKAYNQKLDFEITTPIIVREPSLVRIVTPVMGYNSVIGVMVVELKTGE